ncbi:MAG: hypothetical protein RLZZ241_248 [Bacteroidota bacterium]|jgi:uncharacterized NAD-dependent epimerase/dehydratase family protein
MNNTTENKALIITQGYLNTFEAKTAHGLIRGTDRFNIKGIIDGPETANRDAGELLDGVKRNIPIFPDLKVALEQVPDANYLIVGIATVGGILPTSMLQVIETAISEGLHIVNGLHDFLNDRPNMVALAEKYNVTLTDIRKPKKREQLHFWTGEIFNITVPIIAVIGMDCAMGKRTTARMICEAVNEQQQKATMIYTGQTGWMQGGKYGFIFDSTLNDFVSGELEHAIVTAYKETQPDFIVLEGQSSLRNPSGPCGLELLISGNAKYVVLLFSPKRKYFDHLEAWGTIPTVESEIELIEKIGAKVIAVAIHTEGCSLEEANAFKSSYAERLKIPVLLPLENGVGELLPLLNVLGDHHKI